MGMLGLLYAILCLQFVNFYLVQSLPLCHLDQKLALLQFKNSFSINESSSVNSFDHSCHQSYPKTLSWKNENGTGDCCSWDGITCDAMSGDIIGIDLSCSWLRGKFHHNSTIFRLSHLQTLNLAFNDFSLSQISPKFGRFVELTHLNLSNSGFFGQVPPQISQLFKLISFDLSVHFQNAFGSNDLSFEPSTWKGLVRNLTHINTLVLDGVDLSTIQLSSLVTNLSSSLISLSLGNCGLHGNLTNYNVFSMQKLQELRLSHNYNMRGSFSNFNWSCSSLSILDISMTTFSGELPDSIGQLKSLTYLDLSNCEFEGSIPASLGNLTQLTFLDISFNNFSGHIPSSISNLQNLIILRLVMNNFSGKIPNYWNNLKKLTEIDFSNNNLEGELPLSLFELTQISILDFSSNLLVGTIPNNTKESSNILALILSSNLLKGTIPSWCFCLSSLKRLDLASNRFTGHISEISSYSLRNLDLSSNKLSGSIPKSISNLQNLTYLYLSSNNLSGFVDLVRFPQNLLSLDLSGNSLLTFSLDSNNQSTLPFLEDLNLSSCNISNTFPKFLKHFLNLSRLDISNNNLHGKVPKWLDAVGKDSLEYLNLSHNSLTGIDHQIPWGNLRYLDLSSNLLQGELPLPPNTTTFFSVSNNLLTGNVSGSICNSSSLIILNLSHNNFSGMIPECLGSSKINLQVLDLQNNSFYGTIPTKICSTEDNLMTLNLNGNQLQGTLPRSLAKCTWLEVFDVGNNKIEDTFPLWLETLQELQVLVLRANKFQGVISNSKANSSFPKLRIFDVSDNTFTGILPSTFFRYLKGMMLVDEGQNAPQYVGHKIYDYHDSVSVTIKGNIFELVKILTIFTTIDLSNNKFEGEIPKVIGELLALKGLNLSHNGLIGPLPKSMGSLSNLEWLDLSSNMLIGKIPEELINLNFLQVLNLSGNQFTGCIPLGRHFDTFSKDSYEGNSGLKACNLDHEKRLPPPSTVVLQHEEDNDDESGFGWKAVAIGYGCGALFGVGMGYFVFSTGKPQWLVRMIEGDQNHNKRVKGPRDSAHGCGRTRGRVN
ncbi:Receptor-like protein [Quillaja saponaria]|uniref:Receptor-like protein n=1 Tax=Quillaja saponaria TaxID=32244 RepID=A0AAD7LMM1_QUISA|nr:Receptor-like protein [Quillaja saponaria]